MISLHFRGVGGLGARIGPIRNGGSSGLAHWNGLKLHQLLFNDHFRNHFRIDFQSLSLLQGHVRDLLQHGVLFLNVIG